MARPVKLRKLLFPQKPFTFHPNGYNSDESNNVVLFSEELEAIRLVDYENMNQAQAAKSMNISRPTLTRIYDRARKKISLSLIELKTLKYEGGNTYFKENWYKCSVCESLLNIPDNKLFHAKCPLCGNKSLISLTNNTNL